MSNIDRYSTFISAQKIAEKFSSFLGHVTGAIPSQIPTHIDDKYFDHPDTKTVSKMAKPVNYQVASSAGTVQTKEGPVSHPAGFHIMNPGTNNSYPVAPDTFHKLYTDHGDGTATPKPIMKKARRAVGHGSVNTSWGEKLHFTDGNDWIVKHGPGDYGVVKNTDFKNTYQVHD